ncbi:hypothetical protein CLU97_1961 [Chryseobacterium sp. 7]|nr:hypothetical protein [Chryseobacterium sp. 7]RLJ32504.1 hypothetical protein CLU97_1961 [Chryseobacterium sp. 7]
MNPKETSETQPKETPQKEISENDSPQKSDAGKEKFPTSTTAKSGTRGG